MVQVPLAVDLPNLAAQWMVGNMATLVAELGREWPRAPACSPTRSRSGCASRRRSTTSTRPRPPRSCGCRPTRPWPPRSSEVDLIIAATNPGPAFAADVGDEQPRRELRRLGQGVERRPLRVPGRDGRRLRAAAAVAPRLPVRAARRHGRALPRAGEHGWAHHDLERLRQPGGVDPGRHDRRAAGRHAGAGAPPRRRPAVRRGAAPSSANGPGRWWRRRWQPWPAIARR